ATPLAPAVPAQWAGDAALARRLALESGLRRLVVLNAPVTFVTMYNAAPGGNLPLWWAYGETPVPVGWDFGYPERYEPLYRRVAEEMDPRAAAELGVTHIALAPAALPLERHPGLARLLRGCRGQLVAAYGDPSQPTGRELYRLEPSACTPADAPA
ncbi:MAG TPA: hypothetical protein VFN74_04485, partial [Chloroflexota bacterium]|nr:hypothetical protein [Chloroflexota bacterium]